MRYFVVLWGLCFFAGIASAQNTAAVVPDSDSALETSAAAPTEAKKPVALPDCNDARLLELTRRQLAAFQAAEGAGNLYDRRAQKLAVKNTAEFEELSVADFVPRDNYRVANRIISYKINRGLSNEDMRLCRGNNPVLKSQLYLLLYPQNGGISADIINYGSSSSENSLLRFTY